MPQTHLSGDAVAEIAAFRAQFAVPRHANGAEQNYFCGNSLGLMPWAARREVQLELTRWAELGVEAHFDGETAWMPYHRLLADDLAWLVGAKPSEVVAMNSLTVNLQLMLTSFYRPTGARRQIVIERRAFPSDRHAALTQVLLHGFDPEITLVEIDATDARGVIDEAAVEAYLRQHGEVVALVLWPGVQYAIGQRFDLARLTRAAHAAGAVLIADLAHAVGNVQVDLHACGLDAAVWCSYKYLNSGPGALAGAFVHERHHHFDGPRLGGWWGHDQATRFRMAPEFNPMPGAEGWQLSNPPILAAAPLRASLKIFRRAGWPALETRADLLHARLRTRIEAELSAELELLTPAEAGRHGCQLSIRVRAGRSKGRAVFEYLQRQAVVCDWREPDVIRAAPVPLYNHEADVDALVAGLAEGLRY